MTGVWDHQTKHLFNLVWRLCLRYRRPDNFIRALFLLQCACSWNNCYLACSKMKFWRVSDQYKSGPEMDLCPDILGASLVGTDRRMLHSNYEFLFDRCQIVGTQATTHIWRAPFFDAEEMLLRTITQTVGIVILWARRAAYSLKPRRLGKREANIITKTVFIL